MTRETKPLSALVGAMICICTILPQVHAEEPIESNPATSADAVSGKSEGLIAAAKGIASRLSELQETLKQSEQDRIVLEQKNRALSNELSDLRDSIQSPVMPEVESQVDISAEYAWERKRADALKEQVRALQTRIKQHEVIAEQIDTLQEAREDLERRIKAQEKQKEELADLRSNLRERDVAEEMLKKKVATLQNEIEMLQDSLDEKGEQILDLRGELNRQKLSADKQGGDDLEKEIEALRKDRAEGLRVIAALKEQIAQMAVDPALSNGEDTNLSARLADADAELEHERTRNMDLQAQLEASLSVKENYQLESSELDQQLKDAVVALDQCRRENTVLQDDIAMLQDQVNRAGEAERQRDDMLSKVEELNRKRDELQATVNEMMVALDEAGALRDQADAREQKLMAAEQEKARLQTQVETFQKEKDELADEVEELKSNLKKIKEYGHKSDSIHDDAGGVDDPTIRSAGFQAGRIGGMPGSMAASRQELRRLMIAQERATTLERENENLAIQVEELEKKIKDLLARRDYKDEVHSELKNDLSRYKKDIRRLDRLLTAEEREKETLTTRVSQLLKDKERMAEEIRELEERLQESGN